MHPGPQVDFQSFPSACGGESARRSADPGPSPHPEAPQGYEQPRNAPYPGKSDLVPPANVSYDIQSAVRGFPYGLHPLPRWASLYLNVWPSSGRSGFDDGLRWSNPFSLHVSQPHRFRVRCDAGEVVTEPLHASQKERGGREESESSREMQL